MGAFHWAQEKCSGISIYLNCPLSVLGLLRYYVHQGGTSTHMPKRVWVFRSKIMYAVINSMLLTPTRASEMSCSPVFSVNCFFLLSFPWIASSRLLPPFEAIIESNSGSRFCDLSHYVIGRDHDIPAPKPVWCQSLPLYLAKNML